MLAKIHDFDETRPFNLFILGDFKDDFHSDGTDVSRSHVIPIYSLTVVAVLQQSKHNGSRI